MGKQQFLLDHLPETAEDAKFEEAAKMNPRLSKHRTLVLNADYQPISYFPLSTMPWTKVMFWLVKGWSRERSGGQPIINVLAEYDDVEVRTSQRSIKLPSVVAHTRIVPPPKKVPFTRFNVFLRDEFTCQYTGAVLEPHDLTFDHVIPESRGGKTNWENIVSCSREANFAKGDKSLKASGLKLARPPYEPTVYEIRNKGKKYPPKYLHETWMDYLYWNSPLE